MQSAKWNDGAEERTQRTVPCARFTVTWLCGLYRFEDGLPHFVVLTKPPSEEISFIHDRMPLMLREKDVDEWISPDAKPNEIASRAVTDLHFEKAPIEKPIEDEYTTFLPTPIGMEQQEKIRLDHR